MTLGRFRGESGRMPLAMGLMSRANTRVSARTLDQMISDIIADRFSNNEPGLLCVMAPVINDQQVMWQDLDGTVPVTADGDPTRRIDDLSGNGNHAYQDGSTSCPTYRTDGALHWLEYDGVDDSLGVPEVDMSHTNQQVICAGVTKVGTDGTFRSLIETSFNVNNFKGALISAPSGGTDFYRIRINAGAGAENLGTPSAEYSGATTNVVTGIHAPGIAGTSLRVDGAEVASGSAAGNDGVFESRPWYIGSRSGSSAFFEGRVYALAVFGEYSAEGVNKAEALFAKIAGVTLP